MALKRESRLIGDLEFTCLQFGAMKSYKLFARLGKTVGPALSALKGVQLEGDLDIGDFAPALSKLLERLSDDEVLVPMLLKQVSCEFKGKQTYLSSETIIDAVFDDGEDGFESLIKCLRLSLEVNFGSFFQKGLDQIGSLAQPEKP